MKTLRWLSGALLVLVAAILLVAASLAVRGYAVLGTDGFGRSDYRPRLRNFFEVDRHYIAIAALGSLAEEKRIPAATVEAAIRKYGVDPDKPNPATV